MAKRTDLPDKISANAIKLCNESEASPAGSDPVKVIELLEKAHKDSPESRSVAMKLAAAYSQTGSYGKAVKILESADISDEDTELGHQLANAYADRKWNKKAVSRFHACLDSNYIYPELIQDYAEFMLDNQSNSLLAEQLIKTLERISSPLEKDSAAMCLAMLYSALGDCAENNISLNISDDFLAQYLDRYPENRDKEFFILTINYLSSTPNSSSIIPITNKMFKTMSDAVPSLSSDKDFLREVADFEISLILFENDVTALTAFAMRSAKLKFAGPSDDKDNLKYLVFDAKMSIVDLLRKGPVDTESFRNRYPYLWTLISDFVDGASKTSDLRQFARENIYNDLRNASPKLMKIFEKNLSSNGYQSLKKFISIPENQIHRTPASSSKTASRKNVHMAVSSKIAPNSPCPCGSGKKYKKCCGLK